jgi:hypothetical protein
MKLKLVTAVSAAVALALIAGPAAAITSFPAPQAYRGSVVDRSSLFSDQDADSFLEPEAAGAAINIGDEQRNLFSLDAVNFGVLGPGSPAGTLQVSSTIGSPPYTNGQLTGMLYDLQVLGFEDTSDGDGDFTDESSPSVSAGQDIYFGAGGRYADVASGGGSAGSWTDAKPGVGGLLASTAGGYGGLLVVYDDNARNSDFRGDGDGAVLGDAAEGSPPGSTTIGPWDWREPGDVTGASGHPGVALAGGSVTTGDYFPTISDIGASGATRPDSGTAIPWLVGVLAPLNGSPFATLNSAGTGLPGDAGNTPGAGSETLLIENEFDPNSGGDGFAMVNIIGGAAAGEFQTDVFGPGWDVRLDFEIIVPISGGVPVLKPDGWQVESDDPIQWATVPAPTTICLLGMGLLGLAGVRFRRKRRK